MNRKTLLGAALAGAALMGFSTAQAAPAIVASATVPSHIIVQAPPPPIYEHAPAPRAGWIWAPGHYEWRDGRYAWTAGRWIEDRPGWAWQEARWLQRPDGSWHLVGGQWIRSDDVTYDDRRGRRGPNGDMDGDGVRNADDRDRDGDGVANRDDDFPNNPDRS
jgi:hypothetical protein